MEVMEDAVLCGVIECNGVWCEVYCDADGVLLFDNHDDGVWCITEVNIGEPLEVLPSDIIKNIDEDVYGDCVGVIYGYDGTVVVLLDESRAAIRRVWDLETNEGQTFYYSTDEEYEME